MYYVIWHFFFFKKIIIDILLFGFVLNIIYTYNVFIYVSLKMIGNMYISYRFWEIIPLTIEPSSSLPFLGGCETCDIYF